MLYASISNNVFLVCFLFTIYDGGNHIKIQSYGVNHFICLDFKVYNWPIFWWTNWPKKLQVDTIMDEPNNLSNLVILIDQLDLNFHL